MPYDVLVHHLAQRVCRSIREQELLRPGDRLGVAVSGGADSVSLLRLLLELREELGLVLSVVHVNHQIRGTEADADQQFVADLALQHGLALHALTLDSPAYAAERRLSLEAAAREVRYQYFQRLLAGSVLGKVATAHTLDDQAETVLLRLARGTGIKGLAGIYPKWPVGSGQWPERAIVRPLLQVRRCELQAYLQSVGQAWREDASNLDPHFARNRVRHKVLPLLQEELNPRIPELLAETAAIARAEEEYWAAEVSRMLPQVWSAPGTGAQPYLQIDALCRLPLALQRRLVRAAAESMGLSLAFQHVEELLEQAQAPPVGEKQIVLPGGSRVLRLKDRLQFEPPECGQALKNKDFAYRLASPGEVAVAETGTIFRAIVRPISPEHAGQAYDPARLEGPLQVRNWRPGDRFWPGHTRAAKKIKELLQERKIPPAQRRTWPVVTMGASGREQVIWLRGFPPPQQWLAVSGQEHGLIIEECALQEAWHGAE